MLQARKPKNPDPESSGGQDDTHAIAKGGKEQGGGKDLCCSAEVLVNKDKLGFYYQTMLQRIRA